MLSKRCSLFLYVVYILIQSLTVSGVTRIGREDAPVPQDITIQGPGIEAEHCLIINEGWFSPLP